MRPKHIIIAGVPRAGKSTVSRLISREFGCQHISMDSILAGIEHVFPITGINTEAVMPPFENLQFISSKIAPFIQAMMKSGEYDEMDEEVVIDVCQLLPRDYIKFIDRSVCGIHFFITADVSAGERFELLKKFDTEKDYTFHLSDEENRKTCVRLVEESRLIRSQCLEYGLPYYETSKDRTGVIRRFLQTLSEEPAALDPL